MVHVANMDCTTTNMALITSGCDQRVTLNTGFIESLKWVVYELVIAHRAGATLVPRISAFRCGRNTCSSNLRLSPRSRGAGAGTFSAFRSR